MADPLNQSIFFTTNRQNYFLSVCDLYVAENKAYTIICF